VTDEVAGSIASKCGDLTTVSLFGCWKIGDSSVQSLLGSCKFLSELSLRGCHKLTNLALQGLPVSLKALNLSGCKKLNGESLSMISKCHSLEKLNAHGLKITDDAVKALSRGCNKLLSLQLSSSNPFGGGSLLSDASLYDIATIRSLRFLDLEGSSLVSDSGIGFLVSQCRSLERLNVGGCFKLSDLAVTKIASNCQHLTHLSLFFCENITDVGMRDVVACLCNLQVLDLHGCKNVTEVTLNTLSLPRVLSRLSYLDITLCDNISHKSVTDLASQRPALKINFN